MGTDKCCAFQILGGGQPGMTCTCAHNIADRRLWLSSGPGYSREKAIRTHRLVALLFSVPETDMAMFLCAERACSIPSEC